MKKKIISSIILICILTTICAQGFALTSAGACAIDADSGRVLYEYNADTPLAPASMTKVMTAYIIYDKIRSGDLSKDTYITCSANAAELSRDSIATNVPLNEGEQYSIDELIGAIMIPSACAACTLVGEYISGSEAEFANLMNSYAAELGLDAYYEDASGLSDSNRITPRSMAILGAKLIKEFPDILNYTSMNKFTFRGKTYDNTNALLPGRSYEYGGADGLKTGTTTLAGRCLTATAIRDGRRVVGVTMRSTSTRSRYTDIHEILNAGFEAFDDMNTLFASQAKMYINGAEIPGYYCGGNDGEIIILAENLASYGFDIDYNESENTVYVTRDKQGQIAAIDDGLADGASFADVNHDSDLRVVINDDGYYYAFDKVYDAYGFAGIAVDEFKNIYRYEWQGDTNSGHFGI